MGAPPFQKLSFFHNMSVAAYRVHFNFSGAVIIDRIVSLVYYGEITAELTRN